MTEHEIAKRYVVRHLSSNVEMRRRISEVFTGEYSDADAESLILLMKDNWSNLSDSERLSLAQAVAGVRHYNIFLEMMKNG
jgi:hypothetical protein